MLIELRNRFRRASAFSISIIALATILAGAFCGLQALSKAAQRNYEKIRKTTPVKLIVTNLTGTRRNNLETESFVFWVFNTNNVENSLVDYIKDVQMKASHELSYAELNGTTIDSCSLSGITDPEISGGLWVGGKENIQWFDQYSSDIFSQRVDVCLIPESWLPEDGDYSLPLTITLHYSYSSGIPGTSAHFSSRTFTVGGTHRVNDTLIYCPFQTIQSVYSDVSHSLSLDSIQATLVDNDTLDHVYELAKSWFATPDPTGAKTPWDYSWHHYYPYAMVVDNEQLLNAERILKTSMLVNEICAYLLFVLSAGASLFVGFLMIRQRKHEIILMRSLGTEKIRIFCSFFGEQMIYLLSGIFIGGLFFLWQPISKLFIFLCIYMTGIILSLAVFLNSNLLSNLKEVD